ncbi:MAG: putative toxin-antitoxin system toxin component, PIN family [Synergistaceae bacterium]|jgi:putative PIN family toxin of toxin-antitoxin system|nr:putative toxin-antitoxin system toxin component, PIN family [Synergistaceae bacterium]
MRVLLDTNILVSASRSDQGTPYLAFVRATTSPNQGIVCDQNLDELRRVYIRKFSHKLGLLERFLAFALPVLEIVHTPVANMEEESKIRDASDRPILRAAIAAKADILITGDKDFLESGVTVPKVMTAVEFLEASSQEC